MTAFLGAGMAAVLVAALASASTPDTLAPRPRTHAPAPPKPRPEGKQGAKFRKRLKAGKQMWRP